MKKVLFISYSFPPYTSGPVLRAVKFVKYLPQYGWKPIVLTVDPRYYFSNIIYRDSTLLSDIGKNINTIRTPMLKMKNRSFINIDNNTSADLS